MLRIIANILHVCYMGLIIKHTNRKRYDKWQEDLTISATPTYIAISVNPIEAKAKRKEAQNG